MSPPPIAAQGLGKRFRREWGLRGLTLEIPSGAIVGLAGPNGAGKSTLLALATGLLAPTEGTISVLGRDPLRSAGVLAKVGYVAQGAPLYRSFSVAETIEFARRTNAGWEDEAATDLLTRIDSKTKVGSLSEGDRERHSGRQLTELAVVDGPIVDPSWTVERVSLEELLLAYMAPERLPTARPPEKVPLRWHG